MIRQWYRRSTTRWMNVGSAIPATSPQVKIGEAVHEEAEQEDQQPASNDLSPNRRFIVAARAPRRERQMRRDAGDEEEEREDEVRRRPAVPRGVLERRIDRAPRARIVDEQHAGDGQPAENVEGQETFRSALSRRAGRERSAGAARGVVDVGLNGRAHMCHPVSICGGRLQLCIPSVASGSGPPRERTARARRSMAIRHQIPPLRSG